MHIDFGKLKRSLFSLISLLWSSAHCIARTFQMNKTACSKNFPPLIQKVRKQRASTIELQCLQKNLLLQLPPSKKYILE